MAVKRRSMVATDNFSAHAARYSARTVGLAGMLPLPLAKKCRKSEAYARFVAADWLAAMNFSAVPEKPLKTASGGVSGMLLVSAHLTTPFPGRSELGMLMSM
jgi:hypothetical protein